MAGYGGKSVRPPPVATRKGCPLPHIHPRSISPDLLIAALVVVLGVALFLACPAPRLDRETPLPWDMSHHFLGALSIRDGIRDASPQKFVAALREGDLYPPGHSVILGAWLAACGESSASVRAFQLCGWFFLLATLWAARGRLPIGDRRPFFIAAAAALLLTTPLVVLSKSLMVEVPATGLAMAALVLLGGTCVDSMRAALGLMFVMTACILTKYNIGLPLLPVGLVLGVVNLFRGERRRAVLVLMATLGSLALWLAFLAWQHEGWNSFLAFARNRANAEHESFTGRLQWYLDLYRSSFLPMPWLAWIVWALGLAGLARLRDRLALSAWTYVGFALAALGRHPYLLDRNLVSLSAVFVIAIGCGASAVAGFLAGRNRFLRIAIISVLLLASVMGLARAPGQARGWCKGLYPASSGVLVELSRHLSSQFSDCHSCLVVGAFNELSPAWLTILWNSHKRESTDRLTVDLPFPLVAGREREDPRPDPAYAAAMDDWAAATSAETAITIDVLPTGAFNTDDYDRWNAWKRNYVDALRVSPWFVLMDSRLEACGGVRVRTYRRLNRPLRYPAGWDPLEAWGRWAVRSDAKIEVPELPCDARLVFCVAAYEGLGGPQKCEVFLDGAPALMFEVTGSPWEWQGQQIPLRSGPVPGGQEITIRFSSLWPGNDVDRRPRALPFARISLAATSAEEEGCGARR